jgi:hypothetical protein
VAHGEVETAEAARQEAPAPAADPAPPADPAVADPAPSAPVADLDLDRVAGMWASVIEQMRQAGHGLLAAAFDGSRPVAVDPGQGSLEIGFPGSAAFNRRKAEAKDSREVLGESIRAVLGASLRPVFVTLEEPAADEGGEDGGGEAPADEGALVDRIVAEFDAEEVIGGDEQAESGSPPGMPEADLKEGAS